ncbi:MAG: sulfatase-like hydrolase/transferase, partial [Planctomycetaceae bacterium]|nr:sulfatase-like hydrolase/transferase [Planctomycetaceae bacterium]
MKTFKQLLSVLGLWLFSVVVSRSAEQPNILFVFADDQCFETIGAFGHTEIQTPNLDKLVAQGTTFTHAYNMGSWSGAVCVASRCMLNTGRFIWHANSIYPTTEKERQEGRFWSEYM